VTGWEYSTHVADNKYVQISSCKTKHHLVDPDLNCRIYIEVGHEVATSVGVHSWQWPLEGFCEHVNDRYVYVKGLKFREQLRCYQFLK
jgi:hypothetical protein